MNTLKIKVLLILTNSHLFRSVNRSLLIWITTTIGGCLLLYGFDFLLSPPVTSIVLSLIFSSPALLIAIPLLYHFHSLNTTIIRIAVAIVTIILTSGIIIGIVAVFFNLRYFEVGEALLPFIPSAVISFFLVARKQITKSYPV